MYVTASEVSALDAAGVLAGLMADYIPNVSESDNGAVGEAHGNLVFRDGAPSNAVQKTTAALVKLRAGELTPPAPTTPIITYKADVVRRCTDDEAAAFDAALSAASVKLRLLWNSIQYIDHGAAEFSELHDAILAALSQIMPAAQAENRTTTLLMPSE